jgi:hypothetical protein
MGTVKRDGFGAKDARLAKTLAAARGKAAADNAARRDGHKDARAARTWLRDRSK